MQLGDRMVRYAVGPLREWLAHAISESPTSPLEQRKQVAAETLGYDEPVLRGGRRKKAEAESFGQFVALARTGDEWPFVLRAPFGRPVASSGIRVFEQGLQPEIVNEDESKAVLALIPVYSVWMNALMRRIRG